MFVQFYLWSDSIPYIVVDSIWLDAFETQLSSEWWKIQVFIWRHEPSLHRTRATWMMMIFSLKSWRSSLFASVEKNCQHSFEHSYCSIVSMGAISFLLVQIFRVFPVFSRGHILKNEGSPRSERTAKIPHGKNPRIGNTWPTKRFSDDLWALWLHRTWWTCELPQVFIPNKKEKHLLKDDCLYRCFIFGTKDEIREKGGILRWYSFLSLWGGWYWNKNLRLLHRNQKKFGLRFCAPVVL